MIKKNNTEGFTLVETLIAISILVLAITGAFAAAQNGISSATFSKNQIVAFYLAEEGVEEIRNIRDQNGLSGANWLAGIAASANDPCYFDNACIVDAVNNTVSRCDSGPDSCPFLKLNNNGFYAYDSGADTTFKRVITLKQVNQNNPNEVSISVAVSWSKGLISNTFTAQENILNWQ